MAKNKDKFGRITEPDFWDEESRACKRCGSPVTDYMRTVHLEFHARVEASAEPETPTDGDVEPEVEDVEPVIAFDKVVPDKPVKPVKPVKEK